MTSENLRGEVHTLVADPPWKFGDKLPGASRGAAKQYRVLTLDEIRFFLEENGPGGPTGPGAEPGPPSTSVADMLADDCRLFLWRVSSMQQEALDVLKAWGFVLKTELVWVKRTSSGKEWFGMGRTLRASHETCLVASRGKPERLSASVRTVFNALRGLDDGGRTDSESIGPAAFDAAVMGHSVKPDRFYEIVEAVSPGPFLELFARQKRAGWECFGDELESLERAAP